MGVGRLARIEKIASKPFEIVDTIASNIVVRGYYQSNIDAGMEPEAAMRAADAQAARLMADRSLGQMPNVYSSKLFMGVLGQFQLEVANNLKWMKDITRTYSPGRAAAILTLLAVMSKLTNEAWKQLMYPVDASDTWTRVQTLIFGKSSTRYARMYYDEGRSALTADNTTKYQQLREVG